MKITKEEIIKELKKCGEISYPPEERLLYNHFIDYIIDKTDLIKIDEYKDYHYYATVQYNKIISELKELSIKTKITRELIDSLFFIYSLKIEKVIKDEVKYKDYYSIINNKQSLNKLLLKGDSWKELLNEALVDTKENGSLFSNGKNGLFKINNIIKEGRFNDTPLDNFVENGDVSNHSKMFNDETLHNSIDEVMEKVYKAGIGSPPTLTNDELNKLIEHWKTKKHTSKKDMLESFFHILLNGGYKEEIQNMFNKFKELDKEKIRTSLHTELMISKRYGEELKDSSFTEDFINELLNDNCFTIEDKLNILKRDSFKSYEILIHRNKNKLGEILELSELVFDKLTLLDLLNLEKYDGKISDYVSNLKETKKLTDLEESKNEIFVDKYNFEDELDGVPLGDYVYVNDVTMGNFRLGLEVTNPKLNEIKPKNFKVENKTETKEDFNLNKFLNKLFR